MTYTRREILKGRTIYRDAATGRFASASRFQAQIVRMHGECWLRFWATDPLSRHIRMENERVRRMAKYFKIQAIGGLPARSHKTPNDNAQMRAAAWGFRNGRHETRRAI